MAAIKSRNGEAGFENKEQACLFETLSLKKKRPPHIRAVGPLPAF